MPAPYLVLKQRFVPKRWRAWYIGRRLTEITEELGLIPLDDPIHGPQTFRAWCDESLHAECGWHTYKGGAGEDWHYEGDTTEGAKTDSALVVWASKTPTEFQYKNKIYQPKPFQLVIGRNLGCLHRRPGNAPDRRWFFRQRVEIPTFIQLP